MSFRRIKRPLKVVSFQSGTGKRPKTEYHALSFHPGGTTAASNPNTLLPNATQEPSGSVSSDATASSVGKQTYHQRKEQAQLSWDNSREAALSVSLSLEHPWSSVCVDCGSIEDEDRGTGIIRCLDCGPFAVYCNQCETKAHRNVLHKPEIWNAEVGCFRQYFGSSQLWQRPDHRCGTEFNRGIMLIDAEGRVHNVIMTFCCCEEQMVTLIRWGYWPSSPEKPSTGYSLKLMTLLTMATLEGHVSITSFIQILRWKNNLSEGETKLLSGLMVGECVPEYRIFHRRQQTLEDLVIGSQAMCPVCPLDNGPLFYCLDGNFGLVRKSKSGISFNPPRQEGSFFVPENETKPFVDAYYTDKTKDRECNNFLAGDSVRSSVRNARLEIRGLMGSCCRHEIPILFMDLYHGERLAYPVLMLEKLLERLHNPSHKIHVIYDIACILYRHLQKSNRQDLLEKLRMCVPAFHALGHNVSCQEGTGLLDGEAMERLWAYLRRFSAITKEMTQTHRVDLLNNALHHYKERKISQLGKWFETKFSRAKAFMSQAQSEIVDIMETVNVTEETVQQWKTEELLAVQNATNVDDKDKSCWEDDYLVQLQNYSITRFMLQASSTHDETMEIIRKLKDLESSLCKTEASQKIVRWTQADDAYQRAMRRVQHNQKLLYLRQLYSLATERTFILNLMKRYCATKLC